MKKSQIQKNLYDLNHNIYLTKAATFLGLAFSSWLGLFFGIKEEMIIRFMIATIGFIIFLI